MGGEKGKRLFQELRSLREWGSDTDKAFPKTVEPLKEKKLATNIGTL